MRFSTFKIVRLILGIGLVALFIAISVSAISKKESLRCQDMRVFINKKHNLAFVNEKDIQKEINSINSQWIGTRVQDVSVNKMEDVLRSNKYVEKADIYINQQGVLNVFITQKNPIIRVDNSLESYYLSDKWEKIPLSPKFTKRTIHIIGRTETFLEPITPLDSLISLEIKALTTFTEKNEFWKNSIDQIIITPSGKIELILIYSDALIKLGYIHEKLEARLNKVFNFYKITTQNVDISKYKELDFQFENQVVGIKKENNN